MSSLNGIKKTVTVKIELPENSENVLAVNFPHSFNIEQLKEDISKKFKISGKHLIILQGDETLNDDDKLCHLDLNHFGIIEIKLRLTEDAISEDIKLDTSVYYTSFTLPDIITVHVPIETEDGETIIRDLVVEIENKSIKKPFLGGYIHKKTKIEYHHAFTQTGPSTEQIQKVKDKRLCRETQTVDLRRIAIDTNNDRSTQYFGEANELLYLKSSDDIEVETHNFETFEESEKRKDILGKTRRITQDFTGPGRIVEIQILLEKEIQLLNGIEKRRCEIQKEMEIVKQDRLLQKHSETVKWIGYKDALIEMDTLRSQRARKLAEYFKQLRHSTENIQDRLMLMNNISEALMDENSNRIIELENLFQRERELLSCKLSDDALEILRRRQLVVFMDVIKDEERNKREKPICRVCERCKTVQPMANFVMHSRQKDYDLCRKCSSLKASKTDLSVYRAILRGIRRDERRRGALTSLAFIIQETDIKKIIENIWHGISILSQCDVTSDLRLPRWNVEEEWSPWNCVCLTDSESRIHTVCIDLEKIYGDKIIKDCLRKHSLAKSTFRHLKKIDSSFDDPSNDSKVVQT
ncbi:CLUMA_CG008419, isoform A [Clunio marinus]|uniref:CLUMA_CG008419, isoform A n=1 Tax=Clunio marinus TaxID=568069 RepID=A0A1J1I3P1_9DIPT|nr:CLUMA_CG008419, isoform A [Clunio marinus]